MQYTRDLYNDDIVLVSDFDFALPADLIAQEPLSDRAGSKMLRLDRTTGKLGDASFQDLPELLRPDDLLVFNNTKVFPARLLGHRSGNKAHAVSDKNPASRDFLCGQVEALLTKQCANNEWQALVRPGRKIDVGEKLFFGEENSGTLLVAEVVGRGDLGERTLRFQAQKGRDFFSVVEQIGHVPLPPYIDRADSTLDRERYQTIYAKTLGSVAAPTAGLHFTTKITERIRARGIEIAEVTLHVGLGTFQPVRHERVEDNTLHAEPYTIDPGEARQIRNAKAAGRRIVAIGTTTLRTLEYVAAQSDGNIVAGSGEARIFIYPGFKFRVVDALLTNFHLPKSTLLMLVCAFAGRENVLSAYHHAVKDKYRFFSYGDCMFME